MISRFSHSKMRAILDKILAHAIPSLMLHERATLDSQRNEMTRS
jgi:hypothetical protein